MLRAHFPDLRSTTSKVPFSRPATNRRLPLTSTSMWSMRPLTFGKGIFWISLRGGLSCPWILRTGANQSPTVHKSDHCFFTFPPESVFTLGFRFNFLTDSDYTPFRLRFHPFHPRHVAC